MMQPVTSKMESRFMIYRVALCLALLSAYGSLGCFRSAPAHGLKLVPVNGMVTLDGTPVDNAVVIFHPKDGGREASAQTDGGGKFTLGTYDSGDGAVAGEYKVTVVKVDVSDIPGKPAVFPPKNMLPSNYANLATTSLEVTVGETGEKSLQIQLVTP